MTPLTQPGRRRPSLGYPLLLLLAVGLSPGCARRDALLQPDLPQVTLLSVTAEAVPPPQQADPGPEAVLVSASGEDAPADDPVFSLTDAIAFALRNNPRLRAGQAAVARAQGQEQVAFAPFLPEMDLFSRYGGTSATLSPGAPGPVGGILASGDGSRGFVQAEVDVQWTLWDFGRTAGHHGQAVARERIAERQLVRARQTVAFDVTSAYLGVLLAEASRRVQEQAVRRAEYLREDAVVRRRNGVADPDDVLRADVQLSEAREALVVARQAEFDAVSRLNYALGRDAGLPLRVLDWRARPPFDRTLGECLETAAAQRQEVAVAREAVAAARYGLDAATAEYLPHIYIRASIGHVDGEGVRTGWQEGAAIHLDQRLYSGGRRRGEQWAAEADVAAAGAQAQTVLDGISLEVSLAYRGVRATRERIPLTETAVTQATENLRLVRVKYKNGNATPTDVVDAETTLTRSEQRYHSAVYDYLAALARLEYALGTPQGCLVEPAPGEGEAELLPPPRPLADTDRRAP
jgi:outer membrane protein TolC